MFQSSLEPTSQGFSFPDWAIAVLFFALVLIVLGTVMPIVYIYRRRIFMRYRKSTNRYASMIHDTCIPTENFIKLRSDLEN